MQSNDVQGIICESAWGIKLPIHFPSKNMTKLNPLFAKRVLGHQSRMELRFLRYNFKFALNHRKFKISVVM